MNDENARMARERRTIEVMIHLYCREQHKHEAGLCTECGELLDYAMMRLDKCPYQEGKTTCAKCPVHCYKPVMREKIRQTMRYAGPRMLLHHPGLALLHLWDGRRKKPLRRKRQVRSQ